MWTVGSKLWTIFHGWKTTQEPMLNCIQSVCNHLAYKLYFVWNVNKLMKKEKKIRTTKVGINILPNGLLNVEVVKFLAEDIEQIFQMERL